MQANVDISKKDICLLRTLIHPLLPEQLIADGQDLITRMHCGIGDHAWGDWEVIGHSQPRVWQRTCPDCKTFGIKLNYIESNACAELFEKYPGLGKSVKEVTNA